MYAVCVINISITSIPYLFVGKSLQYLFICLLISVAFHLPHSALQARKTKKKNTLIYAGKLFGLHIFSQFDYLPIPYAESIPHEYFIITRKYTQKLDFMVKK